MDPSKVSAMANFTFSTIGDSFSETELGIRKVYACVPTVALTLQNEVQGDL